MSRHHWRNVVCEGCFRRCRYRDFKVFDRNAFTETVKSLWKETDDSSQWKYRRRGTVLGIMHQTKRELWEQFTGMCPHWGEKEESTSNEGEQELASCSPPF